MNTLDRTMPPPGYRIEENRYGEFKWIGPGICVNNFSEGKPLWRKEDVIKSAWKDYEIKHYDASGCMPNCFFIITEDWKPIDYPK